MKNIFPTAIAAALCLLSTPLQADSLHNCDSIEQFKELLNAGADVNALDVKGLSPLHRCLSARNCKMLLDAGANPNILSKNGANPLHYCNNKEVAELLIAAGANVNNRDNYDSTPLHACLNADVCRALLAAGADVNARDIDGHTPLHLSDAPEISRLLIQAGANVNGANKYGTEILYSASVRGATEAVRVLLENGAVIKNEDALMQEVCYMGHAEIAELLLKHGAKVTPVDQDNNTLLHYACKHPMYSYTLEDTFETRHLLIQQLLNAGCDPNACNKYGNTPLHTAIAGNAGRKCIEVLLAAGANPQAKGTLVHRTDNSEVEEFVVEAEDATLLHIAARNQSYQNIPLLLAAGVDTQAKDSKGRTAADISRSYPIYEHEVAAVIDLLLNGSEQAIIQYAIENDDLVLIRTLKKRGVNLTQKLTVNRKETSPLHLVKSVEMAQELIAAGADVNATNEKGQTPLFVAPDAEITRLLLANGADIHHIDKMRGTALNWNIFARSSEEIEILLEAGAELNPQNAEPPLHVACRCCNLSAVQLLLSKGADLQLKNHQGYTAKEIAEKYRQTKVLKLLEEYTNKPAAE